MSNSREESVMRADAAVEALLERAAPRPAPPADDEQLVRAAVQAEWQAVTGRLKTRRRMKHFAIAATVLLGVAVSFNALQPVDVPALQVARISKSHGSIYLLGEQSELRAMSDLSLIYAGQVIDTGDDAGMGLEWGNGGSLRIDQNTRIEFTSADSVFLHAGQVYFDSQNELVAAITGSALEIETGHGSVKHQGTQYMTAVDVRDLTVSVREGEVVVDGTYVDQAIAVAGQQLTVSGGARPSVVNIDGYGEAWDWIEATAPTVNMDGKSTFEFLQRIGREIGLALEFESAAAETLARDGILQGTINLGPRDELAFRMAGEDLSYRIEGGTIYVSSIDSGRHP